jgi:hypothetical protein
MVGDLRDVERVGVVERRDASGVAGERGDGGGLGPLAADVAEDGDPVSAHDREDVVEVAGDLVGPGRCQPRRQCEARHRRERGREERGRERAGDAVTFGEGLFERGELALLSLLDLGSFQRGGEDLGHQRVVERVGSQRLRRQELDRQQPDGVLGPERNDRPRAAGIQAQHPSPRVRGRERVSIVDDRRRPGEHVAEPRAGGEVDPFQRFDHSR